MPKHTEKKGSPKFQSPTASERATLHLSSSNSIPHHLDSNFHVILIALRTDVKLCVESLIKGMYFHHPINLVYLKKK